MKYLIIKDYKLRKNFFYKENKILIFKSLLRNTNINENIRQIIQLKFNLFLNNTFSSRIKNRCILTGRSRGLITKYRISRLSFREYVEQNYLLNIVKK